VTQGITYGCTLDHPMMTLGQNSRERSSEE